MKRLEPEIIDYYNNEVVMMIVEKYAFSPKFFMYLLEYYADYKNRKTGDVLEEWEKCGIMQKIYDNYWLYHTERIENAYSDIDSLMETGKYAW